MASDSDFRPIILVRGFDPGGDANSTTYYGFNDGTVYPNSMGDDFIYEGMLLKFLKTAFLTPRQNMAQARTPPPAPQPPTFYQDATNAVRFLPRRNNGVYPPPDPADLAQLGGLLGHDPTATEADWLTGPMMLEPAVAARFQNNPSTVWVYRYYDFRFRDIPFYAAQLERLIAMVEAVTGATGVNLICHSMGGLVARYLLQRIYKTQDVSHQHVNKWVTLGTPHRGIEFQVLKDLSLGELEVFNRNRLEDATEFFGQPLEDISPCFDPRRLLCVIGTSWRTYAVGASVALNQLASWLQGQDQNCSDGLVKQECAALKDAHRAYVHKCHGGSDSLITSREAFELSTRFFFGDICVQVRAVSAAINPDREQGHGDLASLFGSLAAALRGGRRQYLLGFSVKTRRLDFYLNRQDPDSENCFGPFDKTDFVPDDFRNDQFDPARSGVLYEGFLNSALIPAQAADLVFRFDTYVGERDPHLLGHSDTAIVRAQSYFQAFLPDPRNPLRNGAPFRLAFYPKSLAAPPSIAPGTPSRRSSTWT